MHIIEANLDSDEHRSAIVEMVNAYAQDPMADGQSLDASILNRLGDALREHPTTIAFLAYNDQQPIGVAVCFLGFSTFAAAPLLNVHDLGVLPEHRGQGIGRALLGQVETKARELGCCKVTLEVFEENRAKRLYESCGFVSQTNHDAQAGRALYLQKPLTAS